MSGSTNKLGWVIKPLIQVATLQRGYDLPIQDRTAGRHPIFAANGPVGFHGSAKCKGPGVVTGRSGTIGKVHFVPEDYWPLNTSLYVTDFHGNDPKWVYYMLKTFGLERYSQGAGVPTLNRNLIHGEPVSVPPLDEQRRIAAILDQADSLRAKRRKALALLDELQRGIFIEMFGDPATNPRGWPTVPFESLCSRVTVGIVVQPSSYYQPKGVVALRSLNIKPGKIVLDDVVYFSPQDNETKLTKTRLRAGDLVLVRTGQPGTAAVVPNELDGVNAIDILIATPVAGKCNVAYLCEFFNSQGGRGLVLSAQRGQIQKHLNVGALSSALIPMPPLAMQNEFASRISALKEIREMHLSAKEESGNLFRALQFRAFRGEL